MIAAILLTASAVVIAWCMLRLSVVHIDPPAPIRECRKHVPYTGDRCPGCAGEWPGRPYERFTAVGADAEPVEGHHGA